MSRHRTTTDERGLYVCSTCHQANLIAGTPNRAGTVVHRGMGRHTWIPSSGSTDPGGVS